MLAWFCVSYTNFRCTDSKIIQSLCGGDIVVYDTSNYFKILTIFLIADHHDDRYAMDDAHMASF